MAKRTRSLLMRAIASVLGRSPRDAVAIFLLALVGGGVLVDVGVVVPVAVGVADAVHVPVGLAITGGGTVWVVGLTPVGVAVGVAARNGSRSKKDAVRTSTATVRGCQAARTPRIRRIDRVWGS